MSNTLLPGGSSLAQQATEEYPETQQSLQTVPTTASVPRIPSLLPTRQARTYMGRGEEITGATPVTNPPPGNYIPLDTPISKSVLSTAVQSVQTTGSTTSSKNLIGSSTI